MSEPWRDQKVRRPRAELEADVAMLERELRSYNSGIRLYFGGSWRREAPVVGDLDVLIVKPNGRLGEDLLESGIVFPDSITFQRHGDKIAQGDLHLSGGTVIHIDVWCCKPHEMGAFLWFITGPKDLNVVMRQAALNKGWNLSQNGLFVNGPDRKPNYARQVDDGSEYDVAAQLGEEWLPLVDPTVRQIWLHELDRQRREVSVASVVKIASSSGGSDYDVRMVGGQAAQCNCRGYVYRGRCRHLAEAEALYGSSALGARPVEDRV